MCGIAGIFSAELSPPDAALIRAMTDAIAHRGPDGDGFFLTPGLALGHRRLAVIDVEGGDQPMFNEDGAVCVVFNGEIYNFQALRPELEALGHVFRNRCDTEAIVHAWEQWGPDCVDHLSGMFAFALWDARRGELFLARDRLGKKPLHYAWANGALVFGSELAALRPVPGLGWNIDPAAVDDFFAFGYVPDPATIFAGIHKLAAAHAMLVRRGEPPTLRRYWSPPTAATPTTLEQAEPALLAHLRGAVEKRLIADVPLGAFLSGGVDSSAVVAIAAGVLDRLSTFTVGFAGQEDETPYAHLVAARYRTDQHDERAEAVDMIDAARSQAAVFGEPFGDSSSVPTLAVCALARQHATVAISGDGGDEVFGGYRRYRWHALAEGVRRHIPAPLRRSVIGRLAAIYPKLDRAPRWLRARNTLTELSLDSAVGYARTVTRTHASARRALFSPTLRAALDGHDPAARIATLMAECDESDPLMAAQYVDLHTWLPGDILSKVDRASMACGLEVRAPFLDHDLLSWGMALPAALKLAGGQGKFLLKKVLEPLLPRDILYRPKQGFATELGPLFRREGARVRPRLLEGRLAACGLFDPAAISRLLDQHEAGGVDHAQTIWLLLCFDGFLATRP